MRGQPNGLVGAAAWDLPPGPQVAAQPCSEDIDCRSLTGGTLSQPTLDLLPGGAGKGQVAAGPHHLPSRWMTVPTAAETAMGHLGP
eukprot:13198279-Alexandrium_andersonii.AAC.1